MNTHLKTVKRSLQNVAMMFLTGAAMVGLSIVSAHAQGLASSAGTASAQASSIAIDVQNFCLLVGAAAGLFGVWNLRKHDDREAKGKGFKELGVGALAFTIGYVMHQIAQSYGASGSASTTVFSNTQ